MLCRAVGHAVELSVPVQSAAYSKVVAPVESPTDRYVCRDAVVKADGAVGCAHDCLQITFLLVYLLHLDSIPLLQVLV